MKKIAFVFAAALVALVSCNKETADVKEQGITRTFGVQFVETKVEFGDESGSTINVKWANGDEVAVQLSDNSVHKGTVSVSGTTSYLSVSGLTAAQEALDVTDAWYPYNEGVHSATVVTTQSGSAPALPVRMTSYNAGTLAFAIETAVPFAVIEIPVKQSTTLFYNQFTRDSYKPMATTMSKIVVTVGETSYTLNINETAKNFKDLADPAKEEDHSVTYSRNFHAVVAPFTSQDVKVEYVTKDGVSFTENKGSKSISASKYGKMTAFDLTGYHFWKFGSENAPNNTDCNSLNYWFRTTPSAVKPGADNLVQDGKNYMTIITNKVESGDNRVYHGNFSPVWYTGSSDNSHHACFDGSNLVHFANIGLTLSSEFPLFVICMQSPEPAEYSSTGHVRTASSLVFDPDSQFNRVAYKSQKNLTTPNVFYTNVVSGKGSSSPLNGKTEAQVTRIQFKFSSTYHKDADFSYGTLTVPTFKVLWAGTFRNTDEIDAFYAKNKTYVDND